MSFARRSMPERIVCLVEEPTEVLYALGEQERIVGISAYTVRPEEAAQEKPVVSAFIGGSIKKIKALEPDLVIGFSDIQAQLAHDLIKAGLQVLIFNQRSIQDILDMILMLGQLVGASARAAGLVDGYIERLQRAEERSARQSSRPRVYFEEWNDPMICGIGWVGELVELAGGRNVFAERSKGNLASERFVSSAEVIEADPQVILASWCGEPVDEAEICAREGWASIEAVTQGRIHEIDSSIILQPGPACLGDGLDALEAILRPLGE